MARLTMKEQILASTGWHHESARLANAINMRRPWNGFITAAFMQAGWTGQPDYAHVEYSYSRFR